MLKLLNTSNKNFDEYPEKYSEIFLMNVNDLKEHPANSEFFNQPTKEEIRELETSLKTLGQINPVIINKNNEILAGHQRWKVIKDILKWDSIYVRRFYGTPEEEIQILIDDNIVRRNIKPEYLARIEKNKFKYYSKEAIINQSTFSPKVRNMLLPHLDKISIEFLAHIASLPPAEQVLIVDQLMIIFEFEKERFNSLQKELSKQEFDSIKNISENEKFKEGFDKLRDLNSKLHQKDEIIEQLKKIINQKEKEITLLKDKRIELENKIDEIKDISEFEEQIEELKDQLNKLKNEIKEKENEIVKTKCDYDILNKQYKDLLEKKDEIINKELKEAKEQFNLHFQKLKEKEEKLLEAVKEKDEQIAQLKEQLKTLQENKEMDFKINSVKKFIVLWETVLEQLPIAIGSASTLYNKNKDIDGIKNLFKKLSEGILMITSQLTQFNDFTNILNKELNDFKKEIKNIVSI